MVTTIYNNNIYCSSIIFKGEYQGLQDNILKHKTQKLLSVCIHVCSSSFNNKLTCTSIVNMFFDYPFVSKCSFKTMEKQGNVAILSTTQSHCTLMAYSVQWLSQSDYSICISILVEFY